MIIDLDGQSVTFFTKDERIKFILFLKNATNNSEDIEIDDDEVEIAKKYNKTTVVLLKNKYGCVVYWNNEKIS